MTAVCSRHTPKLYRVWKFTYLFSLTMGIEVTPPIFQKSIWIIELFYITRIWSHPVLRDHFSTVLVKLVHSKTFRFLWLTFSKEKKSFYEKAPQLEDKQSQKSCCFQGSTLHDIENLLLESSKTCTNSSCNTCYQRTASLRMESGFPGRLHTTQGSLRSLRMFLWWLLLPTVTILVSSNHGQNRVNSEFGGNSPAIQK